MDKIWLKNYPAGVPHEVHPEQYRSVAHLLEEAMQKHAKNPFSVCMERWMDYAELDRLSAQLGAYLQGLGLEPGARVAIMLPNIPQFGVTMAAVLRAGYTCVNVNPLYTARELEHQLKDSGAEAIVIVENFASVLEHVVARTSEGFNKTYGIVHPMAQWASNRTVRLSPVSDAHAGSSAFTASTPSGATRSASRNLAPRYASIV